MNRSITFPLYCDCLLLRFWTIVCAFCMHVLSNIGCAMSIYRQYGTWSTRLPKDYSDWALKCTCAVCVCATINWTRTHEPKHTATQYFYVMCALRFVRTNFQCTPSDGHKCVHKWMERTRLFLSSYFALMISTKKKNTLCVQRTGKTKFESVDSILRFSTFSSLSVISLCVCVCAFSRSLHFSFNIFQKQNWISHFHEYKISEYFVVSLLSERFFMGPIFCA